MFNSATNTTVESHSENQTLDDNLVNHQEKKAEFIPFEIVHEEGRRPFPQPSRWQLAFFSVVGILAIIGIATAGIFLVVIGLLIAIPLIILRGIIARMFRR